MDLGEAILKINFKNEDPCFIYNLTSPLQLGSILGFGKTGVRSHTIAASYRCRYLYDQATQDGYSLALCTSPAPFSHDCPSYILAPTQLVIVLIC